MSCAVPGRRAPRTRHGIEDALPEVRALVRRHHEGHHGVGHRGLRRSPRGTARTAEASAHHGRHGHRGRLRQASCARAGGCACWRVRCARPGPARDPIQRRSAVRREAERKPVRPRRRLEQTIEPAGCSAPSARASSRPRPRWFAVRRWLRRARSSGHPARGRSASAASSAWRPTHRVLRQQLLARAPGSSTRPRWFAVRRWLRRARSPRAPQRISWSGARWSRVDGWWRLWRRHRSPCARGRWRRPPHAVGRRRRPPHGFEWRNGTAHACRRRRWSPDGTGRVRRFRSPCARRRSSVRAEQPARERWRRPSADGGWPAHGGGLTADGAELVADDLRRLADGAGLVADGARLAADGARLAADGPERAARHRRTVR